MPDKKNKKTKLGNIFDDEEEICWRGAAEVAVTFHQGVSTTPPHQAAGDCVCLVSGYFFIKCLLYYLLLSSHC